MIKKVVSLGIIIFDKSKYLMNHNMCKRHLGLTVTGEEDNLTVETGG